MRIRAGRRAIEITHPDRVVFPAAGVAKEGMARYYAQIAPVMVPHVRDRPLAMHVFPRGVREPGHYLKNAPAHFPDWIARATVPKRGGTITHVLANDAATLVYLAGQNMITPHVWSARADEPRRPDRIIFDLDPATARFAEVRAAARALGDALRDAGLEPFAMVTGSRGIHVVAPLRRWPTFEAVFDWSMEVARRAAAADPRRLTTEFYKSKRGERLFIDTRRNAYAQHAVAPYGVRPRPTAPVATPLHWEELSDRALRPDRWDVRGVLERVASDGDPWKEISRDARALPRAQSTRRRNARSRRS